MAKKFTMVMNLSPDFTGRSLGYVTEGSADWRLGSWIRGLGRKLFGAGYTLAADADRTETTYYVVEPGKPLSEQDVPEGAVLVFPCYMRIQEQGGGAATTDDFGIGLEITPVRENAKSGAEKSPFED